VTIKDFIWQYPHIVGVWEQDGDRITARMLNHLSGRPNDIFFLTPERMAKTDLLVGTTRNGVPACAEPNATTLLQRLAATGAMHQSDLRYGMVFSDLRQYFLRAVNFKANPIYAAEFFGGDTSDGRFETMYLWICDILGPKRVRAILYLLGTEATRDELARVHDHLPSYRDYFDALADATEQARSANSRKDLGLAPKHEPV
jgi:hypothetical protein